MKATSIFNYHYHQHQHMNSHDIYEIHDHLSFTLLRLIVQTIESDHRKYDGFVLGPHHISTQPSISLLLPPALLRGEMQGENTVHSHRTHRE